MRLVFSLRDCCKNKKMVRRFSRPCTEVANSPWKLLELPVSFCFFYLKTSITVVPLIWYFVQEKCCQRLQWFFFPQQWLHVKIRRTGEAGAFTWSIPSCYGDVCSPRFEMWGHKWRLFCVTRGGSIQYGLENEEGDRPIHLSVRYICIQHILKGHTVMFVSVNYSKQKPPIPHFNS